MNTSRVAQLVAAAFAAVLAVACDNTPNAGDQEHGDSAASREGVSAPGPAQSMSNAPARPAQDDDAVQPGAPESSGGEDKDAQRAAKKTP
jgi:hypothetical protein